MKQAGWQGYFNIGGNDPRQTGLDSWDLGLSRMGGSIQKILLRSSHRSKIVLKFSVQHILAADIENRYLQEP